MGVHPTDCIRRDLWALGEGSLKCVLMPSIFTVHPPMLPQICCPVCHLQPQEKKFQIHWFICLIFQQICEIVFLILHNYIDYRQSLANTVHFYDDTHLVLRLPDCSLKSDAFAFNSGVNC